MKRFLRCFLTFLFLTFIGVQSAHHHAAASHEPCHFCALADNAARHAVSSPAAPVVREISSPLASRAISVVACVEVAEASSRAPPAA